MTSDLFTVKLKERRVGDNQRHLSPENVAISTYDVTNPNVSGTSQTDNGHKSVDSSLKTSNQFGINLPISAQGKIKLNPSIKLVNPKVNSEAQEKNEIDTSRLKSLAKNRARGRGRVRRWGGRGKWASQIDPNQPKISEVWKKKAREGDGGNQS